MATQQCPRYLSMTAAADLSTKQFFFIELSGGKAALATTAQAAVGVLQDKPSAADEPCLVAELAGNLRVVAGAAVAADAPVTNDTTGRAVTATSGEEIKGYALEAASAAGEQIEILAGPFGEV